MYKDKRILAIIPARGGSKGIPRKNIREVGGKPLIAWTIEEAKKSKYLDRTILSSENAEIINAAQKWGCDVPFTRPAELARDETPGIDPVLHAMQKLPGYDYILMLQPTSPLRLAADIDLCIEHCISKGFKACVSVTLPDKNPYWMYTLDREGKMKPLIPQQTLIPRRQELPTVYALNGAVYIAESAWLAAKKTFLTDETSAYIMPKERSLDIDTEADLEVLSLLLANRKQQ